MLEGIIIKAFNSFYYIRQNDELVVCKLRGRFKQERYSITVGDRVQYQLLEDKTGIIEAILPRQSVLRRPLVANVDQVILTFAAAQPDLHPLLLDRFLVLAEHSGLETIIICINKMDLADKKLLEQTLSPYRAIPRYQVVYVSAKQENDIDALKNKLTGKISVFAGPSGVGKSTLLNALDPNLHLATGAISDKIKRGKHTTRLAELMPFSEGGFVVDTPGFSATDFNDISERDLSYCFPEFVPYIGQCHYSTCTHDHEPKCAIKTAVEQDLISKQRYESYMNILHEIQNPKGDFKR